MRKLLIIAAVICFPLLSFAQDTAAVAIQMLYDNAKYDEVIARYGSKPEALSAAALYKVGMAYYMKEEDDNCLKFMDLVIAKDPKDAQPHYIKGAIHYNHARYETSIPDFKAAIALDTTVGEFYSQLGDVYYNLKQYDLAMNNFNVAIPKLEDPGHAYLMIANVYYAQNLYDKALAAFYEAKRHGDRTTAAYRRALFNIGQLELSERENYDAAETSFLELNDLDPTDYSVYSKLVRICYHRRDYEKAKRYKATLYEAHAKGLLKGTLADRFCIDIFDWKDREIQVFERYQDSVQAGHSYFNKVIFFVNKSDSLECTVQLEYSTASLSLGGPKYLLCGQQTGSHETYGLGFNEDFKYDDLKRAVVGVLDKKYTAAASSGKR